MPVSEKEVELLQRRRVVADLYVKGWTQWDIAVKLGVHQSTVCSDIKYIRRMWQEDQEVKIEERALLELAKLDNLERVAWEQYLRSCEDGVRIVTRKELGLIRKKALDSAPPPKNNGRTRNPLTATAAKDEAELIPIKTYEEITRTGRVGDVRFLQLVRECVELRCKILNIGKVATETKIVNVNWDDLAGARAVVQDPLAEKLKALPPPQEDQT